MDPVNFGNNIFINPEPDIREEIKILFNALSLSGKITMELQDIFWGVYVAGCTGKFE